MLKPTPKVIAWVVVLLLALCLLVAGAIAGQSQVVLGKAVRVCLECVGIA